MKWLEIIMEAPETDWKARRDAMQAPLSALTSELERTYPGLDLHCYIGSGGNLIISAIVVPKGQRENGIGTAVMNRLMAFADEQDIPVSLTPDPVHGGSVARLKAFYKRFGFRPNKGRSKDYRYSELMLRRPNR